MKRSWTVGLLVMLLLGVGGCTRLTGTAPSTVQAFPTGVNGGNGGGNGGSM